ncbi:MAG: GYD domain-containing protein [Nitrososphaerales archaeon]
MLIFINLGKIRKKPDKKGAGDATKMVEEFKKKGIKVLNWYWTLGRYDTVFIFEAASEKEAMKLSIDISEFVATETLVAIPRQEAVKLL